MRTKLSKEQIPWFMAAARAVLGPILIAGAECGWNGVVLAGIVVAALVSDIYDGVLARRWKCDTAGVGLLGLEAGRFVFDFVKFGRPASYHSYLAKTWGLVMAIAVIGSFAARHAS